MNPLDLITAGVGIVNKLIEIHNLNKWAKLIFGFIFTFITTYSTACGSFLIGGHNFAVSCGYGLISAAGAITALFFISPQTRGIMIVQDKHNMPSLSDYQTVERK